MERNKWEFPVDMRQQTSNATALLLLAALLVGVFFLALGAYGYFAAVGEGSLTGELPDAVLALRGFVEENEAVAVFLGLSSDEAIETMGKPSEEERIREAAEAYIREKQG
ncbi:MAG: hypothetical protein IJY20_04300 [Clostridia bacterium]|nr:hypothetical protein [Clostridia bacterium]